MLVSDESPEVDPCWNCGSTERDNDGECAMCHDPHPDTPPRGRATQIGKGNESSQSDTDGDKPSGETAAAEGDTEETTPCWNCESRERDEDGEVAHCHDPHPDQKPKGET